MIENNLQLFDPVQELQSKVQLPINTANNLQVTSNPELEQARDIVRILKELQDEVNKVFEPIVKQAFAAHKAAKKAQNEHLEPLERAEAALKLKMSVYIRKMELGELIRKKEEQAKEEAARKTDQEQKREILKDAPEGAQVLPPKLRPLMYVPADPNPPPPPKVEGVRSILIWKWKVVDASQIPAEFWILDEQAISAMVRSQKGNANIPGIEVFEEKSIHVTK